ncbi:baseplate J/gp47 family protein [Mycetohabitans rhizoxinica]|uniref:baseplate J/gp47 family protein n=1 Tax=Mycetohabitans rhizoxinica TaxID=412963 RepID=UPI0030D3E84B
MATEQRANNDATSFVLDDRSIGARLDAFRAYCQRLPFQEAQDKDAQEKIIGTWAQVLLGVDAGRWDPKWEENETLGRQVEQARQKAEQAWAVERQRLTELYETPQQADQRLPAERAFLLALMGLLETPRALLNALPAQYRALYYRQMLALKPRAAQADRVTVHFTLADGVRELVLPAGLRLDAGHDSAGNAVQYALEQPMTVNAARLTDMRWVVRDPLVRTGCRARVVYDEEAGIVWPSEGVRLFEVAPVKTGKAAKLEADHAVMSGRVVGSPVLTVAGGQRSWTVTFKEAPRSAVKAELSIGQDWVELKGVTDQQPTEQTFSLEAQVGAPTPVSNLDGLHAATPLLRLTSESGASVPEVTRLAVSVKGAVNVQCATDDGTALSGGGLPFGERADQGRAVNLMSSEWWRLGPKLTQITVTPTWVGLPKMSFKDWYGPDSTQSTPNWLKLDANLNVDLKNGKTLDQLATHPQGSPAKQVTQESLKALQTQIVADSGYPSCPVNNAHFTVQASIARCQQSDAQSLGGALSLFGGSGAPTSQSWGIGLKGASLPLVPANTLVSKDDDPVAWPWRVRVELQQSFLHAEYDAHLQTPAQTIVLETQHTITTQVTCLQNVKGQKVPKLVAVEVPGESNKKIPMPAMGAHTETIRTPVPVMVPKAQWRAPYVPQWSALQVDYDAVDTEVTQQVITPFGYAPTDERALFAGAQLYLGIKGIEAGQWLTLHWQLHSPGALELQWQYLAPGERWQRLPVADGTDGLSMSGQWSVDWPGDASSTSTSLPAGRMWLRASVRTLPVRDREQPWLPALPWLSGWVTNAAQATRATGPFTQALKPGSVTQALDAPAGLQSVQQPWPSTGGQAAETQAQFDARIACRLRHRDRGLNNQDLQTLLHEQYPQIGELAVLPPKRGKNGALQQTIAIMPGPALSDSEDRLRPSLSKTHLSQIKTWLKARTSPWLSLDCVNPDYVVVSVSWEAAYQPGLSRTVGHARVQAALQAAFVPWASKGDDGSVQAIGRAITHGMVRDVLRSMPEVAEVKAVRLNGDNNTDFVVLPEQVAVLTCVPLEYEGLTIAWVRPEQNGQQTDYRDVTMVGNGQEQATLQVAVPTQILGLHDEPINTAAEVELVDLDTGLTLPNKTTEAGLWVQDKRDQEAASTLDTQRYAAPKRLTSNQNATIHPFDVIAGERACGVYRLGAVVKLKDVPDVTLHSAQAGQFVTINVHAATLSNNGSPSSEISGARDAATATE